MLDVTHTDVQADSPLLDQPKPLPEDPYLELDNLRLAGQLQVAL